MKKFLVLLNKQKQDGEDFDYDFYEDALGG